MGVSSDGAGSITRPTAEGHLLAVHRAYTLAGYAPGSVGCFEGHGTGTKVGDTTELGALSTAHGTDGPPAVIGSVKANIGHTKAAAGSRDSSRRSRRYGTACCRPRPGCGCPIRC